MRTLCAAALFVAFCLLGNGFAMAHSGEHQDGWVDVGGNVRFGEAPVCALVLINGQTQFSCDGTGRYDMQVPVDDNGMITVMVFADGFAPFNQTVTPEQAAAYPINILRDQNSPSFQVETTYEPSATDGWFIVSGTINSGNTPVCALVLANGQNMFSCNENVGQFSLDAPLDQDGNITLMVFAAGFKPYKLATNVTLDTDGDGIKNYLDYDDDNDGIFDTEDLCPLNTDPNCNSYTDTITANGKEWLQVSLFTNLSWNDINAACPVGNGGICSGTLNGYDMEGWTWASAADVQTMFDVYGFEPIPVCDDGCDPQFDIMESSAKAWIGAGWRPTFRGNTWDLGTVQSFDGKNRDRKSVDIILCGMSSSLCPAGLLGSNVYGFTIQNTIWDSILTDTSPYIGGWFYRIP